MAFAKPGAIGVTKPYVVDFDELYKPLNIKKESNGRLEKMKKLNHLDRMR